MISTGSCSEGSRQDGSGGGRRVEGTAMIQETVTDFDIATTRRCYQGIGENLEFSRNY